MGVTRCLIFVLVLSWVVSTDRPVYGADVYQGRVVDEETGQPLVGAVVTVIWFRSPIVGMEGTRDFQSAQEAVADSDGKFYLPVSPGSNWNPLSYIRKEPEIVIYQPGYEPTWPGWMVRNKFKSALDLADALKKGTTIKLTKLRTNDEQKKFASLPLEVSPGVPRESILQLLRAVNVQRQTVGFPPYPDPTSGGKKP